MIYTSLASFAIADHIYMIILHFNAILDLNIVVYALEKIVFKIDAVIVVLLLKHLTMKSLDYVLLH